MTFIAYITNALATTVMVLTVAYVLGNIILPLFNIHLSIQIKLYKAPKAL